MCLIIFAYKNHPTYNLVLAANRDEYYERPTSPAAFWEDFPGVLAGRDLKAGGTWLGVTGSGRFAAITNYRDPSFITANPRSRGRIVSDFLCGTESPNDYLAGLARTAGFYNGYNFLAGDVDSLWYFSNTTGQARELSPGLYGLSNHLLDTPWPKVRQGKEAMDRALQATRLHPEEVFGFLANKTLAPESALPHTGVDREWERILSPAFIISPGYGTRSSSLLTIDRSQTVRFTERTYFPGSAETRDASFSFTVSPPEC